MDELEGQQFSGGPEIGADGVSGANSSAQSGSPFNATQFDGTETIF
jgi:hypothetical protein